MLLKAENIIVDFGKTRAVNGVSFEVKENEIVILMGPNGAGKSTVLKALFGLAPLTDGTIEYAGHKVKPTPNKMVKKGVSYSAQESRIFPSMTIKENLQMGAFVASLSEKKIEARLDEVIDFFPVLKTKFYDLAFSMSGGEQQILSLGRALMTNPKLLLLDEPSIGLAPKIVEDVFSKIQDIHSRFNTSIVVVEHNLKTLLKIAHRGYVLAEGRVLLEGKAKDIAESDVLEKAFFGETA